MSFLCNVGMNDPWGITYYGTYFYVTNYLGNNVTRYDLATGTEETSGFTCSTGISNPSGITNDGTYLYVCNETLKTITRYDIATGNEHASGFTCAPGGTSDLWDITVDSTYIYVVDHVNNVVLRYLKSTGASASAGFTCNTATSPWGLTTDGVYLYVATDATVTLYLKSTGGAAPISLVGIGVDVGRGLFYNAGKLYVVNAGNYIVTSYTAPIVTTKTQIGITDVRNTTIHNQLGTSSIALITRKTQSGIGNISKETTKTQTGTSYIYIFVPPNELTTFQSNAYYGIGPCQSSSFDNFNYEFEFGFKYSSYFAHMDSAALLAHIMTTATLDVIYFDNGEGNYRFAAKCNVLGFIHKYKFDVYIAAQRYLTFTSSSPFVNFKIPYALNLNEIGIIATVYLDDGTSEMFPIYGNISFRNQPQYGMADILKTITRTQLGNSFVVFTPQQTQLGMADIAETTTQIQSGISFIVHAQYQVGMSNIFGTQTQSGIADIEKTILRTQSGMGDLEKITIRTQSGMSDITV
jgi:hypothetical protein